MKRGRLQEGLLRFWCFKRIQEYDLVETGKVLIPAHLDDLVNLVSLVSMMLSHDNGLVSILLHSKGNNNQCLFLLLLRRKITRQS